MTLPGINADQVSLRSACNQLARSFLVDLQFAYPALIYETLHNTPKKKELLLHGNMYLDGPIFLTELSMTSNFNFNWKVVVICRLKVAYLSEERTRKQVRRASYGGSTDNDNKDHNDEGSGNYYAFARHK